MNYAAHLPLMAAKFSTLTNITAGCHLQRWWSFKPNVMEAEQVKQQFKALLTVNPPLSEIERIFMEAMESGVLEHVEESPESYRTAKIIYYSILCQMAESWKPLIPANRAQAKRLKTYLTQKY